MSRPLKPRRIPISSSTSTLSRLAASRIPISALKCPQSSTSGLSTSTQGGGGIQDIFQSMQESSMTPREGTVAKCQGVGSSFEYTDTVRLGSRCRLVFKTREFRFDYSTHMIDGIEKMCFVCWHFLASRILAEISNVKIQYKRRPNDFH